MQSVYQIGGDIVFYNPGPEMIPIFKSINPVYRIETAATPRNFVPKFQKLKQEVITTNKPIFELSNNELWSLTGGENNGLEQSEGFRYTLLDVYQALAQKHISSCRMCGLECGNNRYVENGMCGLGNDSFMSNPFIHIEEEPPINPAIVTTFGACSMRCSYCVEHEYWEAAEVLPKLDPKIFWEKVGHLTANPVRPNSLEFSNPTESLPGLINLLRFAPDTFILSVVFNAHLYNTGAFYEIADTIADVWLLDFRYGNDNCALNLSGVNNYMEYAISGLDAVTRSKSKIIVRILALPGHVECCHRPTIELLSNYRDKIWVSILDQYIPEHKAYFDERIVRRPKESEIEQISSVVRDVGLKTIGIEDDSFWE